MAARLRYSHVPNPTGSPRRHRHRNATTAASATAGARSAASLSWWATARRKSFGRQVAVSMRQRSRQRALSRRMARLRQRHLGMTGHAARRRRSGTAASTSGVAVMSLALPGARWTTMGHLCFTTAGRATSAAVHVFHLENRTASFPTSAKTSCLGRRERSPGAISSSSSMDTTRKGMAMIASGSMSLQGRGLALQERTRSRHEGFVKATKDAASCSRCVKGL